MGHGLDLARERLRTPRLHRSSNLMTHRTILASLTIAAFARGLRVAAVSCPRQRHPRARPTARPRASFRAQEARLGRVRLDRRLWPAPDEDLARRRRRRCRARFSPPIASSRSTAIRSRSAWACSASIPSTQMLGEARSTPWRDWQRADPSTPVQPALHLIAVVAQGAPGRDGMYRLRMDSALIEKVYGWAKQQERAALSRRSGRARARCSASCRASCHFSRDPTCTSAIDAEFSMHYEREGMPPGSKIGAVRRRRTSTGSSQQLAEARDGEEAAAEGARRASVSRRR